MWATLYSAVKSANRFLSNHAQFAAGLCRQQTTHEVCRRNSNVKRDGLDNFLPKRPQFGNQSYNWNLSGFERTHWTPPNLPLSKHAVSLQNFRGRSLQKGKKKFRALRYICMQRPVPQTSSKYYQWVYLSCQYFPFKVTITLVKSNKRLGQGEVNALAHRNRAFQSEWSCLISGRSLHVFFHKQQF